MNLHRSPLWLITRADEYGGHACRVYANNTRAQGREEDAVSDVPVEVNLHFLEHKAENSKRKTSQNSQSFAMNVKANVQWRRHLSEDLRFLKFLDSSRIPAGPRATSRISPRVELLELLEIPGIRQSLLHRPILHILKLRDV